MRTNRSNLRCRLTAVALASAMGLSLGGCAGLQEYCDINPNPCWLGGAAVVTGGAIAAGVIIHQADH